MAVITRVYDTFSAADRARSNLQALNQADIDVAMLGDERMHDYYARTDIVVDEATSGAATGAGVGALAGGGAGLLAGLGILAIPGIGPLVAAGWLAAAAVGAAGGAVVGGTIGALTDLGISDEDAPVFDEAIRRGSVALTVRFPESRRTEVIAALDRVPTVALGELRSRFEAEGWRHDQAEVERQARLSNPDYTRKPPL